MESKFTVRVVVFCLLFLLLAGGGWIWWHSAISAVEPSATTYKNFTVSAGESVRTIASRLKNQGLIRDPIGFFLVVRFLGLDNDLQAGEFRLNPAMSAHDMAQELTHGTLDVWVTIPEGWRSEEIALRIAKTLSIPESEFLKYAREGYMFPDTYVIPKEASAAAVAKLFGQNFEKRVTEDIIAGFRKQGLTLDEAVTLASIVEREGNSDEDRPIIAGILLQRLADDHPLQVDATLQYALGYQPQEKTWWKKVLYDTDKQIDSAFNSYAFSGLPPTPIANPGISSLKAVAFPRESDYYYYIHDAEGQVHFAKTLAEHNRNVEKYLAN